MKQSQREGDQGVSSFCLPSAAFFLTLLSFTSIRPASVFVLYVTTVSKNLVSWAPELGHLSRSDVSEVMG